MKKISLVVMICFVAFASLSAQDVVVLVKEANKALKAYYVNPTANADRLMEANETISKAFEMSGLESNYKAQITYAKILTEMVNQDYKGMLQARAMQQEYVPQYVDYIPKAYAAAKRALNLASKKFEMNESLGTIAEIVPLANETANYYVTEQDYAKAYEPFKIVSLANDVLVEKGESSIFETAEDKMNQEYVTSVCAIAAGDTEYAMEHLSMIAEQGSKEPAVYSNLFNLYIESDEDLALKYLGMGQELDPGNIDLMFAEINYYIRTQDYDKLESKLKMAIEKDPDNPSIYSALGNVYMNLAESSLAEGNMEDSEKYFAESLTYYNKSLELDDKSFEANYSMGTLYYNKAAALTKEMQDLGISKEDQMRYDELNAQTKVNFELALPYFKNAEMLNPSDYNTNVALKEIYVRLEDYDMSNVFKMRVEQIDNGEVIETSYFKEN